MRKLSLLVAAAATALLPAAHAAPGATAPALPPLGAAEAPLFAAGGTPVSNGIFFPGTALCAGTYCLGQPYAVAQGTDIRFYNLDSAAVANSHRIVSKQTKKRSKAPLFQSETVAGPGSTLMKTSHLKPGVYGYFCTIHFGMDGLLEVTE
ncbi:MAG: plastocyanin/azurin family copper-binding protein [Actinomycetota bacterium]